MKFHDILRVNLFERRKNNTPRESPYTQLKKYKDDPSIFISFTEIDKIGINPKSRFKTPLGVYTYPLSVVWKDFDHEKQEVVVPFVGNKPFIYVVKAVSDLQDVSQYTDEDKKRDITRASGFVYRDMDDSTAAIDDVIRDGYAEANSGEPFVIMWNTTRLLSKLYSPSRKTSMVQWNVLLRKLGYNGFIDRGNGIIHPGEPKQAVFLTATGFKSVDKIINKSLYSSNPKRTKNALNYVEDLIYNGKDVPGRVMDIILSDRRSYNMLARFYAATMVDDPPPEVVDAILGDEFDEHAIVELFYNYQSRKPIGYPKNMVKFLGAHREIAMKIIKQMVDRGMNPPPELSKYNISELGPKYNYKYAEILARNDKPIPSRVVEVIATDPDRSFDYALLMMYKYRNRPSPDNINQAIAKSKHAKEYANALKSERLPVPDIIADAISDN